jgi:hypothetical protein
MVIEKMKASIEKRLENAPLEAVAHGSRFKPSSYRLCVVRPYRVSRMLTRYNRMLIQFLDEGGFGEFSLGLGRLRESRASRSATLFGRAVRGEKRAQCTSE